VGRGARPQSLAVFRKLARRAHAGAHLTADPVAKSQERFCLPYAVRRPVRPRCALRAARAA
jgi:hypothetical protein